MSQQQCLNYNNVIYYSGSSTVPDQNRKYDNRKCNIFAVFVMDLLKSQMEYLTFQWGTKTANGTISIPKSQKDIMWFIYDYRVKYT